MAVPTTGIVVQLSQVESSQITKLKNDDNCLGANRAAQELLTGAIDSHPITSLFDDVFGYEEYPPINIIPFLQYIMCLKFDNIYKLKLQAEFTMPCNLIKNIVAYLSFLKKKQENGLKWKV